MNINKSKFEWKAIILAISIASGVLILYSNGLKNQLIFDDRWFLENPDILSASIVVNSAFRILTIISYQAIFQWIGHEIELQRIFNIVLHVINGLLLWGITIALLRHALNQEKDVDTQVDSFALEQQSRIANAAAVASVCLWLFNPMAVYGVQYLTQRSIVLATSFVLLGLLSFIKVMQATTNASRFFWGVLTVASYIFAIMSKEHAAPMIGVLLPLYIFLRRPPLSKILQIASLVFVCGVAIATWLFNKRGFSFGFVYEELSSAFLAEMGVSSESAVQNIHILSIINQLWLFFKYGLLWNVPWPGWMAVDLRPSFPFVWYSVPQLFGPILWLSGVVCATWVLVFKHGRLSLVGLLFIIPAIFSLIELAYVRVQEPMVLYRAYLWSIALPGIWAVALIRVLANVKQVFAIGVFLILILAIFSFDRITSLYNEKSAWSDAFEKMDLKAAPNVMGRWRAPLNLSNDSLARGNYQDALKYAQLADQLGAPNGAAKFNIGSALFAASKPSQALPYLEAAIQRGFKGSEIWVVMAGTLEQVGRVRDAFAAYDTALSGSLSPERRFSTLKQAARLSGSVARFDRSEHYYREMLKLQPKSPVSWMGVAHSLFKQGKLKMAKDVLDDAIDINPLTEFYYARGMIYKDLGQNKLAEEDLKRASSKGGADNSMP